MIDVGKCRSCKVDVHWAKTAATGTAQPLTEDPAGNVILDGYEKAHAFKDHAAAVAGAEANFDLFGEVCVFYVAHHAVCPARAAWRGKTRGRDGEPKTPEPAQTALAI